MLKKIILCAVVALTSSSMIHAASPKTTDFPDGITTARQADKAGYGYTVGSGDLLVADQLFSGTGFMTYRDVFNDLPAPSATATFNTNITRTILIAGATAFTGGLITQPTLPSNQKAIVVYSAGNGTTTVAGTLSIVGTNARGESATESISVSTNSAAGNVAFASITSLTWTMTSMGTPATGVTIACQVGNGTKIGLSNDIQAAGDIVSVIFDDSGTTTRDTTYTLSTTYDTIIQATEGDGTTDVLTVTYKVKKR